MSKSLLVPRDDLDSEPDAARYRSEIAWVRFAGWQINFFDADTDGFDFEWSTADLRWRSRARIVALGTAHPSIFDQ